jgi:hypothetical protein
VDIEIIDNFLSKEDFENIKNTMFSSNFSWYYNSKKTLEEDSDHNFQFVHIFYNNYSINSEYMQILNPVINKLNPLALVRIKANLTVKTNEVVDYGYHTDFKTDTKLYSAVYYINNNNGYTKFENNKIVESKENRMVIFDSQLLHTGTTHTDERLRVLINFNFYKRPSE